MTTYLSTDIASLPLLWILPLIIYLLTFVLVFARKPLVPHHVMVFLEPFLIIAMAIIFFMGLKGTVWQNLPLHLLVLFGIAMVCHGELMQSRPAANHLTEFYLWISFGGVLGGIFNALLAPMLFSSVVEYPLIIVVACTLRPSLRDANQKSHPVLWDILLPLALGLLLLLLFLVFQAMPGKLKPVTILVTASLAGIICYRFRYRARRFALSVGVLVIAGMWFFAQPDRVLLRERNFFGVAKVTVDPAGHYHTLRHGYTVHGIQSLDPARRREPLSYYYRNGPLGQVFANFSDSENRKEVAIIGLGTGTIACYGQAGQHFTFYEINPAIERIAEDPRYFTFLRDCPAQVKVILGDARLSMNSAPDASYDMIILDAFSSDAIPIHLVTREAINLYLSKLRPDGILVFHISNNYLNLKPVLGNLARDARLVSLYRADLRGDPKIKKLASEWVVMARKSEDLGGLVCDQLWQTLNSQSGEALWTDDFSNMLSVFKWNSSNTDRWINSFTMLK